MYYDVHKHEYLTWVEIHLGTHDHPMAKNMCREIMDQIKALVHENQSYTPLAIVLATSKTFLSRDLLNEDVDGSMELLKGDKLCQVMDKFTTLCSSNVNNLFASFRHPLGNRGYISSILVLKANCGYDYIQINYLLGQ